MKNKTILTILLWGMTLLLSGTYFGLFPQIGAPSEDAAILYIYSEHLADTGAITYNAGGEPAEGATDFLWMVILGGFYKLGFDTYTAANLLSFLALLGSATLLTLFSRGSFKISFPLFALCILLLPPVFAAVQGFSPLFFGFFIALSFFFYVREARIPMMISALLTCLIRPDGIVYVGPLLGLAFLLDLKSWKQNTSLGLAFFVLPGLIYFIWRANYFGHLLPLPFYVKSDFDRFLGLFHLASLKYNLIFIGAALPLVVYGLAGLKNIESEQRKPFMVGFISLLAIPLAFYSMMHLSQNIAYRFQFPLLLNALMLAAFFKTSTRSARPYALCCAICVLLLSPFYGMEFLRVTSVPRENMPGISKALNEVTPHGRMAITEAGRLPYYSKWETIDLWGLNTPDLAKDLVSPDYIRDFDPDLIVMNAEGNDYQFLLEPPSSKLHQERSWNNMTDHIYAAIDPEQYTLTMVPHKWTAASEGKWDWLAGLQSTLKSLLGYESHFDIYYLFALKKDFSGNPEIKHILQKRGAISVNQYFEVLNSSKRAYR